MMETQTSDASTALGVAPCAPLQNAEQLTKPANSITRRVLHVINGEHYAGAERVQDLLAAELPQCGFEVAFACVKPDKFGELRQARQATLYNTPMRGRFDLRCVRRLVDLVRCEDIALVHAHTPRSALVGSLAARRAGVPLVYHVHSPTARDSTRRLHNLFNARLESWSLRKAARMIAVSPSLCEFMQQQGFNASQVTCVPNGVPAINSPPRVRPGGTWTLGMAALFRPRKGVEILLEALAELKSRNIDVRLRAIGCFETSAYQRDVQLLAERHGVAGMITWTGFRDDIPGELAKIDLFVLPSLFGEGLPMVILESMAAGVPVIASRVEGVPEAIRDRQEGLLVEPANSHQLANAIEHVIEGSEGLDYAALSQSARDRHGEFFSARAMASGVAEVYRQVLEQK